MKAWAVVTGKGLKRYYTHVSAKKCCLLLYLTKSDLKRVEGIESDDKIKRVEIRFID